MTEAIDCSCLENEIGSPGPSWYAIHVRSKHEFLVSKRLTKTGIDAFLPVFERLSRWKDRKKLVSFPLFPGYLFVRIRDIYHETLAVLKTPGVVRFLGLLPSKPEPVPEEQIISLKRLIEDKIHLDLYPYLKEGERERIKSGPLDGVEGILVERLGLHMLVLSVDILQKGVAIKIEASEVEPV